MILPANSREKEIVSDIVSKLKLLEYGKFGYNEWVLESAVRIASSRPLANDRRTFNERLADSVLGLAAQMAVLEQLLSLGYHARMETDKNNWMWDIVVMSDVGDIHLDTKISRRLPDWCKTTVREWQGLRTLGHPVFYLYFYGPDAIPIGWAEGAEFSQSRFADQGIIKPSGLHLP